MSAGVLKLLIEQGATFSRTITWKDINGDPIDITGYTAKMQIRNAPGAPVLLELATGGSGITIPVGTDGVISVLATAVQTAALTKGDYQYDLEMTSPGSVVTRLLQGAIIVSPEITV